MSKKIDMGGFEHHHRIYKERAERYKKHVAQGRRCGQTTRLIDRYIQEFFIYGIAIVADHDVSDDPYLGTKNRHIEKLFEDRLAVEHKVPKDDVHKNKGGTWAIYQLKTHELNKDRYGI